MSVAALPQASNFAPSIDRMFDAMLALCGAVALGVFVVMFWMCIKYRRGSDADRSERPRQSTPVELAWTLIPFLLFVGIFGWSIDLWARLRTPPADSLTLYVIGKQWMWKVQQPNGRREIDALHVPLGQPIRLIMTSEDVIHSFYIPAFRVKQDVVPGRYTQLWFTPTELGRFQLYCSEFCGTNHAAMLGTVTVMQPADYRRWLAAQTALPPAERGRQLYVQLGCSGCHDPRAGIHAPDLHGIYGKPVHLDDGSVVVADDHYLRQSIVFPASQIVAGYTPIMPEYQHRIDEEDILALIAYMRSIGPAQSASSPASLGEGWGGVKQPREKAQAAAQAQTTPPQPSPAKQGREPSNLVQSAPSPASIGEGGIQPRAICSLPCVSRGGLGWGEAISRKNTGCSASPDNPAPTLPCEAGEGAVCRGPRHAEFA